MSKSAGTKRGEPAARQVQRLEERILALSRTQQIIEEARATLVDQYDYAPLGLLTLDGKGCVREINLTAARMLGRKRSGLLAMPFFTQVEKPSVSAFLHHLRQCHSRQDEIVSELNLRVGRSGVLPVELRSVPVPDLRGTTVWRTTITDITARSRASRELRESEERYRELVEFLPDGIFVVREGLIVFANGAAQRLCGVKRADALSGSEFVVWARSVYRPALTSLLLRASTEPQTPPVEALLARRDGTTVDVEAAGHPFRHEGEKAVLVVARDISQRRRAERQVVAISERERRTFGRDVHDSLCQSLVGAAFLADLLRKRLLESSPEEAAAVKEIAEAVRKSSEEARALARGLCPVRMENTGLVVALHELAADVTRRSRVRCALECDDHLTMDDAGVATNLYRIAQEAVANAIKHGRAKIVHIQLLPENGGMALRVRDDGKGISANPKRSGMGLHTMQYRATMIGGALEVRRVVPRGTEVTCRFPATEPRHENQATHENEDTGGGRFPHRAEGHRADDQRGGRHGGVRRSHDGQ